MSTDTTAAPPAKERSKNEFIKEASHYLRGTILEGLADTSTGAISEDDTQLLKFHGSYQQDDRDLRNERRKQKLEKAFIFMIRVRVPGGVCTPAQWLEIDRIADQHANGTIKLTTRQAFQLHGILKAHLKPSIKEVNDALLDTLAACGDVNRNVMSNPNPYLSSIHAEVLDYARKISAHLSPRTPAYHEIWLDGQRVAGGDTGAGEEDEGKNPVEPIYGKHYLPRKFKIGIAIPPSNDVDIYSQDLAYIAIAEDGKLAGFNVTVGGGMGQSHGNKATYPRLGELLGFCTPEQAVDVAEKVVLVQRDYGDRTERKHARLKYTIQDRGLDWFRGEVEQRLGYKLQAPRPFAFTDNGDRYGWVEGTNGRAHLTLFIEGGRLRDQQKLGLREIAKIHDGDFRLTANQNLIIASVSAEKRPLIEALLKQYGLDHTTNVTGLRLGGMACVALPTCGLALAESERNLPNLVDELDKVVRAAGLAEQSIHIRSSGCPNGCARPYLGEIGLVGKVPGKYNLYLGAAHDGSRLNKLYKEAITNEQIVAELTPILQRYAAEKLPGEAFGDFVIRAGYVKAVTSGAVDFHD
jgi:sulfite reductase (NADPH) hemoprotein beta-component